MRKMSIFGYLVIIVAVLGLAFNGLTAVSPTTASGIASVFDPVAYADGVQTQVFTIHLDDLSVRRSVYWTDEEVYFSHNSLPENDARRVEASGFSDALTMPFSTWTDDDFGFFGYDSLRSEVYEEIKTNPIFAYTVAKYLYDKELRTGDTIGSLNDDWLGDFIRKVEYYMSFKDPNSLNYDQTLTSGYGWDFLIAYVSNNGEAVLTDYYKVFTVYLRMLLDNFVVIGVYENCNARESWALNPIENASLRLPIQVSYLDLLPGFVLAYERKDSFGARYFGQSGTYDCFIGFNRYDKRPVNPEHPGPKPTPQPTKVPRKPTPEPTNPPTNPPERTPEPTPTCPVITPPPTCPVVTPTPTPWLPTPTPTCPVVTPTPTCPGVTPTPTPVVTATPTPVVTATPTPVVTTPPPTQAPTPTPTPQPTKVPEQGAGHQGTAGDGGGGTPVDQDDHREDFSGPATQPTRPAIEEAATVAPTPKPTEKPPEPTKAPERPNPTKPPKIESESQPFEGDPEEPD